MDIPIGGWGWKLGQKMHQQPLIQKSSQISLRAITFGMLPHAYLIHCSIISETYMRQQENEGVGKFLEKI